MWPDLIQKAKEGGLDTIETYVFWDVHEPRYREYNFEGNLDLIRFLKNIQEAGLYAVLRIGPYVCAEWNYGGFPRWLHQMKGIELRTDNEIYKNEMQNFTTLIVEMVKKENLLAPQGGPIIITQIENEYGNVAGPYGEKGKAYIKWCAKMAESLDVGVPWIMCQQEDAPPPMINTCNGFYCHNFQPTNPNTPKMWTENWTGWFKAWGGSNPTRPAEDVAYAVARFFENQGTFQNYYMYHGGTNFGRTSGGPYITTSYDYDAPLDEYGNLRQPKWGHLKQLHSALKSMEKLLTQGEASRTDLQADAWVTKYTTNETSGCFIVNKNSGDLEVKFEGNSHLVPGWSVSILPDCKNEAYNTAKVTTQTSLMSKKPITDSQKLTWQWWNERNRDVLRGKGTSSRTGLAEQLMTTGDESDYLWYMTTVELSKADIKHKKEFTLSVNTTGHVLHAFFNKKFLGTQYGVDGTYRFVFEAPVHPKAKGNVVTLLSATVGHANYGAFFDLVPTGIVRGPVKLIRNGDGGENVTFDLSSNLWSYKIGMVGEDKKIYSDDSPLASKWHSGRLPINKKLAWYKTTFSIPQGEEPVVVDLLGMSKGQAWVNGQSIGRYWTNFTAKSDCAGCDYRGEYKPERCRTDCGLPTQRWYHVPRSFLNSGTNTLVLFEEMGGNPSAINFQTVAVGTACASVPDGGKLELSCQGSRTISLVQFASYGDATGTCGSFQKGSCDTDTALAAVKEACLGKSSCSIDVNDSVLGHSSCGGGIPKKLVVQATC
ncbi:beta-galactosidase 7-like [Aristolochia californica]|uniref:beta-galactosidase 7-like n=1 Tax=Aristolochia californica TaxID=171875 RepID=UPI0035D78178